MKINSKFVLNCILNMASLAKNPSKSIFDQNIIMVTRDTILTYITSAIVSVDMSVSHPQYKIIQDINNFVNDEEEYEEIYYLSMLTYFLTSIPFIHMGIPFMFMPVNIPMEYAWLCVFNDGNDICMKDNNIVDKYYSFKVLLNNKNKFLFDVEDCERYDTDYGDMLHVDGETYDVTNPLKSRYCIVIISDEYDNIKSVWCNDPYHDNGKVLWRLNYLCQQ